jgi:hypothetical protein
VPLTFDTEDGWSLECDDCGKFEFSGRYKPASDLILEVEHNDGWRLDQYERFDGVTLADAECAECGGRER